MAKRPKRDLGERTLVDQVEAVSDRLTAKDVGKLSKPAAQMRKLKPGEKPRKHPTLAERQAPRPAPPAPVVPPAYMDPGVSLAARMHAAAMSTPIAPASGLPTLAQRVAREGYAAYTGAKAKPKSK